MHGRVAVLLLMFVAASASASLVEDSTGGAAHYQFDGGTDRDAPDACSDADETFAVPLGNHTHGFLVPGEDEADHYVLSVDQTLVGGRVTITLTPSDTEFSLSLDVQVPGCEGSVLDDDQQPSPPPQHPEPAVGEQSVGLSNQSATWTCDSTEWFFVINQVRGGIAPASIHVVWTDGTEADVPLDHATPATTAHYRTSLNVDTTIHSASALLPDSWNGRFNIGHGPCDAMHGGAVFGERATISSDNLTVSFTPTETGQYVAAIVLQVVPPEPVSQAASLFQPRPMNCHTCVDGGEQPFDPLMYLLAGDAEADVA